MKTLSNKLNEGLSENALDYLVQPLLSVDEYCSKISDKRAIVVGFFINDADPANDLSNFIDRSAIPILDTEVSPAPTPDGYFMVFVEFQRDDEFPTSLVALLKEVDNLTSVEDWTFQSPSQEEPLELNEKNLRKFVELSQADIIDQLDQDDKEAEDAETAVIESREFWKQATLDTIKLQSDVLTLIKNNTEYHYKVLAESPKGGISFESDSRNLQVLLGPSYNVWTMDKKLVVEHMDRCVVLKNIV